MTKPTQPAGEVQLYRVWFSIDAEVDVWVLARSAQEARNRAEEPDTYDLDWHVAVGDPVPIEEARKCNDHKHDEIYLEHPETKERLTMQEWFDLNDGPAKARAAAQAEFDALPKLFPDVSPRLIFEAPKEPRDVE